MTWLVFALLAPILWAGVNHFDKYIIHRYVKSGGDAGSTILLSAMSGVVVSVIVFFIDPQSIVIDWKMAVLIILNGALLTASYIPYLYALADDETSVVAPLFQLITFFIYILGVIFLNETLTGIQLFAGLLIIGGAVLMTFRKTASGFHVKKKVVGLMVLSSFLIAANSILFKSLAEQTDFWKMAFWEYLGATLSALALFVCVGRYRREFLRIIRENNFLVIPLNTIGALASATARLSFNFAALLVPVALVSIVSGFQPFFILLYGIILTLIVPRIAKEDISKEFLLQKILATVLMVLGAVLLLGV